MGKKRALFAGTVLIASLIVSGCTRLAQKVEGLEIGSPAPKFKLPDLDGREVSLDQYKGKVVLLDFWATWCNPCRMTMPVLEKLQKEYPDTMVLLAINLQETRDEVRNYVREHNVDSRVLLDEEGSVGQVYGTGAIPMHVLIDKAGIVRNIQVGYDSRMATQLRTQIEKLR